MISTFVRMCQFGTQFLKGVNWVSIFEKMSQLGPFQTKIINDVNGINI